MNIGLLIVVGICCLMVGFIAGVAFTDMNDCDCDYFPDDEE